LPELKDIRGIGPRSIEKLADHGVSSVEDLVAMRPAELAKVLDVSIYKAKQILNSAKEALMTEELIVETADKVEEYFKNVRKISTGSKALDSLLGGGVPTRAITTFAGPFATGKTQLCFQLTVNTISEGFYVGWVETEPGTFSPKRIKEICEARGVKYDPSKILVVRAEKISTPPQQLLAYEAIWKKCRESDLPLGLLVVDSFNARFRSYYTGREMLSGRSEEIGQHIGVLETIAAERNAAIVLTAQVMGVPDAGAQLEARMRFGAPQKPYGGHFFLHSSAYILFLTQAASGAWEATLVDAPDLPRSRARFKITERGVEDI